MKSLMRASASGASAIAIEVTPKPKDQSGAKACPPVSHEKRLTTSGTVGPAIT